MFFFNPPADGKKYSLSSHTSTYDIPWYTSCFDLTHAPVSTGARAAAAGLVSMSTRPDPEEGSGTVEINHPEMPSSPGGVGLARAHPLTKNLGYGAFPPDLVQLRSTLSVGALVLGCSGIGLYLAVRAAYEI